MTVLDTSAKGLDWHYTGVSPQLLARVRQNWSAMQIDVDMIWRASVQKMPGFGEVSGALGLMSGGLGDMASSRPVDLLLLFDQGCAWVDTLRHVAGMLDAARSRDTAGEAADGVSIEQVRGLVAVTTRMRAELAAVRLLCVTGLAMPAMQISRSISEDVDLALALLVRRKLARAFVDCRTPEDAADFWRRHVAGGRAFSLVAKALYRYGLDFSEDSEYARWRKEVLVFLGSAVHTSFSGAPTGARAASDERLGPAAQECLYFATIRVQEMCAYSMVLGGNLRKSLAAVEPTDPLSASRLRFAQLGGDIIVDQMRWMTGERWDEAATRGGLH